MPVVGASRNLFLLFKPKNLDLEKAENAVSELAPLERNLVAIILFER